MKPIEDEFFVDLPDMICQIALGSCEKKNRIDLCMLDPETHKVIVYAALSPESALEVSEAMRVTAQNVIDKRH